MMYDLVSSGFSHFRSFLLIDLATGFSGVDLTGAEMMEESGVSYAVRNLPVVHVYVFNVNHIVICTNRPLFLMMSMIARLLARNCLLKSNQV